ncbi:MAG: vanadium-dependent haloperoxidase [Pseudomonadota bacterium]
MIRRRDFLKRGASFAALPLIGSVAGCAAPITSSQSYINGVVAQDRVSPVFHWTDVMLQAIRNQAITPPPATRVFAMAHVAGFNAVNSIEGGFLPTLNTGPAPTGADPAAAYGAAVATALNDALRASFAPDLSRYLSDLPDNGGKSEGVAWGRTVGHALAASRYQDGAEPSRSEEYLGRYPRRGDNLKWSPTGPFYRAGSPGPRFGTFARGLLPGWGGVRPWQMKSAGQFLVVNFPEEHTREFARQLEKIRVLGGSNSPIRTPDQRQIAFFWEDGPRGVTPPGHWQIIAMDILQRQHMSLNDQAHAFAMLSSSQADAAITTWHSKYVHDVVRPETYIRQRASGANYDAGWNTLIPTPGFPAYTSGHSCFSAVSARMICNIIGRDRIHFSSESPDLVNWPRELTGVRRSWNSLWAAAEEGGASREFGGIHWEEDNTQGLRAGKLLADFTFRKLNRKHG